MCKYYFLISAIAFVQIFVYAFSLLECEFVVRQNLLSCDKKYKFCFSILF